MTRSRITLAVSQALSYIAPGGLIVVAVFRLLPFRQPYGRAAMLICGISLAAATAVFHRWQWRALRRREEALRKIFGRMEYP